MSSEKRFPVNLDSIAGVVTGFLLLSIFAAIWFGSQLGIRITADLPADNLVGPFEILTFKFSEPVDGPAIERFAIQPQVDGSFKFVDSKTLQFIPRGSFQPDTPYTLVFTPGPVSQDGRFLKRPSSWTFRVRPPLIVYMVASPGRSSLWTVEPISGKTTQLTDASLRILDFDTARSGEFIVFSARTEKQGIDLWRVSRDGGELTRLLPCELDRCSVPAISFFDRRVAYVREAAGPSPELQFGAPRIWVLDLETQQNAPLYEDQQIIGNSPFWSPDGTRLSSYD
jgi:hypothetical protein